MSKRKKKGISIFGWFVIILVMLFGFYVYATDIVSVNYPKAETKLQEARKTVVLYWNNWRKDSGKITVQR